MEQRREIRFKSNDPVTVTASGRLGQPPMSGTIENTSGSGLQLRVPLPIPCGAEVKVEGLHLVVLGEVCRAEPSGDGYLVGVEVRTRS